MKRLFVISLTLVLMAAVLSSCSSESKGIGKTGISKDEFDRISTGMTYEEVCEIVGGEGDQISESEHDTDSYIEFVDVYRFEGEMSGYAEFEFTKNASKDIFEMDFSAAKLTSKTKINLE